MSGFRLGFGIRINKRNCGYWLFAMCFAGMFYLVWYLMIGAGWGLYYLCWTLYQMYSYLIKGIVLGYRKLYHRKREKALRQQ